MRPVCWRGRCSPEMPLFGRIPGNFGFAFRPRRAGRPTTKDGRRVHCGQQTAEWRSPFLLATSKVVRTSSRQLAMVSRPRHDYARKDQADEALESPQAFARDQFMAQPTEAKTRVEVAKVPAGYDPQVFVGEARAVAVATLQPEVNGCADQQGQKIHVRDHRSRRNLCHYIEDCAWGGIGQQRQRCEFVNANAVKL